MSATGSSGIAATSSATLPGQLAGQLDSLLNAFSRQKLGHSMILSTSSERNQDYIQIVFLFAKTLLCLSPVDTAKIRACESCDSCRLLKGVSDFPSHPDAMFMNPDTARGYSVDSVRLLIDRFHLSRSLSPIRLGMIHSAHLLSAGGGAAANAFLKLLEEPRPESFLLLLSDKPDAILGTLRSRSQHYRIRVNRPVHDEKYWEQHSVLSFWNPWRNWLLHGALNGQAPFVPADQEAYWKERDQALLELEEVYQALWSQARDVFVNVSHEQCLRIWDFFEAFEELIRSVRNFANPALQWLNFRSRANLGYYGNR